MTVCEMAASPARHLPPSAACGAADYDVDLSSPSLLYPDLISPVNSRRTEYPRQRERSPPRVSDTSGWRHRRPRGGDDTGTSEQYLPRGQQRHPSSPRRYRGGDRGREKDRGMHVRGQRTSDGSDRRRAYAAGHSSGGGGHRRRYDDEKEGGSTERRPYFHGSSRPSGSGRSRPPSDAPRVKVEDEKIKEEKDIDAMKREGSGGDASKGATEALVVDFSTEFEVEYVAPAEAGAEARETDPHRLAQRQKQIDYGKNTLGYQRYRELVPVKSRRRRRREPVTPDIYQMCSKRAFEGLVKKWRRMLHEYDPPKDEDEEEIDLAEICNEAAPMEEEEDGEKLIRESAASQRVVEREVAECGVVEEEMVELDYWEEEDVGGAGGGDEEGGGGDELDLEDWDVDFVTI